MSKILVTGGLGFIGSTAIKMILSKTHDEVLNIDKHSYASMPEALDLVESSSRYSFLKIDIGQYELTKKVITDYVPDVILHLAAESHVDNSINSPKEFIESNIIGTYNLLQAANELWTDEDRLNKKFIHASTDEVYGSLEQNEAPFTESSQYTPNSPYAASKASADMLARAWYKTFGIPVIITNCSNNYGPWQFPEKLIPVVIKKALNHEKIPIYGDGLNIRDWLFVEDHAAALINIYQNGEAGEKYNIGGNNEISNLDLVEKICAILDEVSPSMNIPKYSQLISFVRDRPGHDLRYAIDAKKIAKELNFIPSIEIDAGLMKTVQWYVKNKDWLNQKSS
ncbi:dTDP-glucose 4,6-dehydratase [Gammaproteobacteria bacterium]|jgi:dTDP-glucose 4,6-dehydratase|nr:dTDP-glucose 4,6-dehydratase [Gammaproteobacteria bacterium]